MKNKIKLQNQNDKRGLSDLELVTEFYEFLQGKLPDGMEVGYGGKIKLSPRKAFNIIWYLQEHLTLIPSQIDQCDICKDLFDPHSSGHYSEKQGKNYCGACDNLHDFED